MKMHRFVITAAIVLACVCCCRALVVKGLVITSDTDNLVVGATVRVEADSVLQPVTQTTNNGRFSASVPDNAAVCRITVDLPGYDSQTITVNNPQEDVDLGRIELKPAAIYLDAIEVTTNSRVLDLPNKSIIFPTKIEKERALSPINLIKQISYAAPMIDVKEYPSSISIAGEAPQILINGVRKTYDDLDALKSENILKVEFVTYPDGRYGKPYLNVITVKPETGGDFMASLMAPVNSRQENHQIYTSYRRGKQELALNYNGSFSDSRKIHTSEVERYFAPDRTYEFNIAGLPSRSLDHDHRASLDYSLVASPKKMLEATASFNYHSKNDHIRQICAEPSTEYTRHNHRYFKTLSPQLSLYGSLPIGESNRLEMSLAGSFESGDYLRGLSQSNGYTENTYTTSDAYSLVGRVYFEHSFSWSTLYINFGHRYSKASNKYIIGEQTADKQRLHQNRTVANISLSGQLGNILYYDATVGLTHVKVDKSYTNPSAYLSLMKKVKNATFRYTFNVSSNTNSLSDYSTVMLPVNEVLYSIGNPNLKDQLLMSHRPTVSYNYRKLALFTGVYYATTSNVPLTIIDYISDPNSPAYEKFLQTTQNGKRNNRLQVFLVASMSDLFGHLSLKAQATYNRLSTRWKNQRWNKNFLHFLGSASAYFGNWQFNLGVGLMPFYSLYGNFLWRDTTTWFLDAGWHKGNLSVTCMVSDLFAKRAAYQVRTTMAVGALRESAWWDASQNNRVAFNIRYQFSFGQSLRKGSRNVSGGASPDSGVKVNY